MTPSTRPSLLRAFRSATILGAVVLAVAVLPGTASAHGRHADRGHDRHRVVVRHRVVRHPVARPRAHGHVVHAGFVVPTRIRVHADDVYRPYYHGRVYHRGHGHFHAVYRFPVYSGVEVIHRPYAYCGERLLSGHVVWDRGGFGIHIGF